MQVQLDRNLLQLKTKAGIGVVIKVIVKKISQKTKIYESSAGNAGSHLRVNQEAWWYILSRRSCSSAEQII